MHDGNSLRDFANECHVMLNHDDGVLPPEPLDNFGCLVRFRLRHACRRLIKQQHFGILNDDETEFEPLPFAVAQISSR